MIELRIPFMNYFRRPPHPGTRTCAPPLATGTSAANCNALPVSPVNTVLLPENSEAAAGSQRRFR